MPINAVFLDRDGVLNPHIPGGYLCSAADLVLLPRSARAVRRLNDAGLPVIVISNQQGVGKGLMTRVQLQEIEDRMGALLKQEAGAFLDRSYYATELASAQSPRRKPKPGMLLEAAADFGLTLAETVFLGDSPTDLEAGRAAGVGAAILLLSGSVASVSKGTVEPEPDFVFDDLEQAAAWIVEHRT